ncbi:MAG: hypothetical protein ACFFCS_02795 [Candidatus Hodarchaeota archaeon]
MCPRFRLTASIECQDSCPDFPGGCDNCIKHKLSATGLNFKDHHLDLEENSGGGTNASHENIYRMFLDLLNIKAILMLSKEGLCLHHYPVMDSVDDPNLIAGFIQANLSFSRQGVGPSKPEMDELTEIEGIEFAPINLDDLNFMNPIEEEKKISLIDQVIALDYLDFVLLVFDGESSRGVLFLDRFSSQRLKSLLIQLVRRFEKEYKEELASFIGDISVFDDLGKIIDDVFETDLLYPYIAREITPETKKAFNGLQKATFQYGMQVTEENGYFFVLSLFESLKNSLQKDPRDIISTIYDMVQEKYFIPQEFEITVKFIEEKAKVSEELVKTREKYSKIYDALTNEKIEEIKKKLGLMGLKEKKKLFKENLADGDSAFDNNSYVTAKQFYQMAKFIALESGLDKEYQKIDSKLASLRFEENKNLLDETLKKAQKAEKNSDFLHAIQNYSRCREILLDITNFDLENKKIQQIEKKIELLRSQIK